VALDGSGDLTTISEAIADASDGDTVLIRPGSYGEAITLAEDLTIIGDGPPSEIILSFSDGQTPVVAITDSDAVLSNLTISGEDAFVLVSGGSPTLEGLVFDGLGVMEPFEGGCHALFGPTGCNPVALRLEGTQARIIGNTFVHSGEIGVHGGASPTIEGNEMSGGSHIFLEEPGDDTVVRGNDIHDVDIAGIAIYSAGRPLIEGNTITAAGGAGIEVGLQLAPGIEPTIRANTISDSAIGIEVASGALPTIEATSSAATSRASSSQARMWP
jgi:parallel beta-helix repeat protein